MTIDKQKPLAGKRVVVTRAPEQAQPLVQELQAYGAEVLLLPTVAFGEPQDFGPLDAALKALAQFDWIILTSQNAVRFFAKRAHTLGINCTAIPQTLKIAVVGPVTERAAKEAGFRVDHVSIEYHGAGLAAELREEVAGRKVLLPRSDRANFYLPAALGAAGAEVVEVVAYHTVAPVKDPVDAIHRTRDGAVDVVTFASPSAFQGFAEILGEEELRALAGQAHFAAIGPTTAAAIREAGLPVEIEAPESTSAGLAIAIARFFEQHAGVKTP